MNKARVYSRLAVLLPGLLLVGAALAGPSYYNRSYALVVGIDDYPAERWPELAYARRDAEAVAGLLRGQGFEVTTLLDTEATKTAIVSVLQTRLAPRLDDDDRVLVFFAGHGHTERFDKRPYGYLVPYDGTGDSATYLSMEELRALSEKMGRAKHQLFILNACYGGLFALRGQAPVVDPSIPGYLVQVTRRPARQFITAGGADQQVLDGGPEGKSFFTYYLLEALGKAQGDLNGDAAITFSELASYLVPRATNAHQTPVPGALPGHGGGEFVFLTEGVTRTAGPSNGLQATNSQPISVRAQLAQWAGEHVWEIFSGIGTAIVVGAFGWVVARLRTRRSPRQQRSEEGLSGRQPSAVPGGGAGDAEAQDTDQHTKPEIHHGDRSVVIGRDARNSVVVTGDNNVVKR